MFRTPLTRRIRWLAAPVAGIVIALAGAAGAQATTTKCSFYGQGIKGAVRNGQFCSTVSNSGAYIQRVTGNFGTTIPFLDKVCYPSMKVDFYDRHGRWLAWRQGAQKAGCSWGTWNSLATIEVRANIPGANGGQARVTLQGQGRTVSENWGHSIW